MSESNMFFLSVTKVFKAYHAPVWEQPKKIHKILQIPFVPFKDLRIEHEYTEWETIIKDMFELTYNLNGVFYYTDIQEYHADEIDDAIDHLISYGWSIGDGYKFKG